MGGAGGRAGSARRVHPGPSCAAPARISPGALAYRLRNRPEVTGVDRDDYPHVGGYRTGEAAALDLTAAPELDDDPGGATLRGLLRVAVRRGADLATVHS